MPLAPETYQIKFFNSIHELKPQDWNNIVGTGYPFIRYEFLSALEITACTGKESGWEARHAGVYRQGELLALMPLYLKHNSMGEYVFDWSWADAYYQHGIDYYPKLVSAIPFTPCAGPRVCVKSGESHEEIIDFLAKAVPRYAEEIGASGWHILFPERGLHGELKERGIRSRLGCQYQWFNDGFRSFDDFLDKFNSRKRKNLKKERRKIQDAGISFEVLPGRLITPAHWRRFYLFYRSTYLVRGREPYLNPEFFLSIGEMMPESLLLILAKRQAQYIAGALSFIGNDSLFGRYWGCLEEFEFLHFETCYYQGIDYCIQQGLKRFDSGAQGEHKIQRGFEPVTTYSNHWIAHPDFERAIGGFLDDEEKYIKAYMKKASQYLPFKLSSRQ